MLTRPEKCLTKGWFKQRHHAAIYNLTHSRRMLHSTFWRHGAGDLDFPPTCYFPIPSALFEPELTTGLDSHCRKLARRPAPNPLLDLFHSSKARNLIKLFSLHSRRQWRRNVQWWSATKASRNFTTSTDYRRAETDPTNQSRSRGTDRPRAFEDFATDASPSVALKELQEYLAAFKRGQHQESWSAAWRLFLSLEPAEKTDGLVHALCELLSTSPRPSDSRRAIRLFESIPVQNRQPETYPAIIATMLKRRTTAKAVNVVDEALKNHINPAVAGADMLLAHCIEHRLWQVLFRTWDRCVKSFDDADFLFRWKTKLFEKLFTVPAFQARVASLIYAIEAFPNSISPEADKSFVASLVGSVFFNKGHFGAKQNQRILSVMQQLDLMQPSLFGLAIHRTLEDDRVPLRLRTHYAFEIYQECLGEIKIKPLVMVALLQAAGRVGDQAIVLRLYDDWQRLFETPILWITGMFMKYLSAFGDIKKVDEVLSNYIATGGEQSLKLHYPVLHVRALLARPDAVRDHMKKMERDSGLSPDITCWNILMHAYQRDEDLAGAMGCMSEILEAEIKPDSYTFGTLMAAGADRGDMDLLNQLSQSAMSLGIRHSAAMNDCIVLALLNNNRWQSATEYALSATHKTRTRRHTRMWNQILGYHSVKKSPRSLQRLLDTANTMRREGVPFDSYTFSAMMRAYTLQRKTDLARRILHRISLKQIPVTAFHYSLVISGYADEMAFEKGMRMNAEMLQRNIKPSLSSNLALLKLHNNAARNKIQTDQTSREAASGSVRADVPEELFEELLRGPDPMVHISQEPQIQSSRYNITEAYPTAYFRSLISLYGTLRVFEMVKNLLIRYERERSTRKWGQNQKLPLQLVSAIMSMYYRQSAHEDVERYWNLAKEAAIKVSATSDTIREDKDPEWLSPVRRTLLTRHLDIYLRSLSAQGAHDKMRNEINWLLSRGFDLDNRNWNLYAQLLVTRGHHVEAFELCETRLMGSFTGWGSRTERTSYMQAIGKKSPGMQYRGAPGGFYLLQAGQLQVEYATIVRFALALTKLRRAAPFERAKRDVLVEVETKAPVTIRAIAEMPKVVNPIMLHMMPRAREKRWKGVPRRVAPSDDK